MSSVRPSAACTLLCALVVTAASASAWADGAPQAPAAPPAQAAQTAPAPQAGPPAPTTPLPAPAAPQAAPQGAIVVATSDAAAPAARALAFEVYRAAEVRPSIDDRMARTLVGEALPEGSAPKLREIAELRASIAKTPPPSTDASSDLVMRRLLASLGTELGASLVVTVAMDGSRPLARVLRSSTAAFERVELGPTVDIAADGTRTFRWPGATTTLATLLLPPPLPAPAGAVPVAGDPGSPLAPKAEASSSPGPLGDKPFYKSPWFWGSVGGAVAVGLSVFLISRATSSSGSVHLTGKVEP